MRSKLERVFSRQEQAVVYLFARHWESIPEFKDMAMGQIGTRFPDCIVLADDKEEAIEFEYALSSFKSHLGHRGKSLRTLWKYGVRNLWIVYWEDDYDRRSLSKEIRKYRMAVKFVCLRDAFKARVKRSPNEPCQALWEFSKKSGPEAYQIAKLEKSVAGLGTAISSLAPKKGLYRTMGFNTKMSDFVECEHWSKIHFYTTRTRMREGEIPAKLFMKPTGCKFYSGYFKIRSAFEIKKQTAALKRVFNDFYFYDYHREWHHRDHRAKCFVCDFVTLPRARGERLYERLDRLGYHLRAMTPPIIKQEHNAIVDKIISS
jgi:hypothetical protein